MTKIFNKRMLRNVVFHLLIIGVGFVMLYPLLWMLVSSFKPNSEIFKSFSLTIKSFTLENYISGWQGISGITYTRFYLNSFFLVALSMFGNIVSCLMAAYAFGKLKFPLKNFWFALMMVTLMLPKHVKLIPQYVMYNNFGWINTYLPLVVPKFLAQEGFFIFLITQFIRGLPREIDEAATVDGCGPFRLFSNIVVPLSVPAIVTTAIFSFIWTWNDFFTQMIYLNDIKKYTISLALRQLVDAMGNSSWGGLFAMSAVSLVPLFLMFVVFQNYLVEGITSGSVKG